MIGVRLGVWVVGVRVRFRGNLAASNSKHAEEQEYSPIDLLGLWSNLPVRKSLQNLNLSEHIWIFLTKMLSLLLL